MIKKIQVSLLTAFMFLGASLSAGEAQLEKLKGTVDAALDVIYSDCCVNMTTEEKQAKVRSEIEAQYDLDVIIRRAIGRNWRHLDESQQGQVLELVKQLVVKAYVKGLEGKARPVIKYGKVVEVSDKRIEIESTVFAGEKSYHVVYRLGRMSSGWQIYDIVAENISVVSNYRQQIDDHFRRGTSDELISRLKELLTKDDIDEDVHI